MKPAVHTLTYDQAVDELIALCDSRPADDQPIALHHWKEENAQRAVDLEAWIMMKTPKTPKAEDAPPQHMQPEPPKASKPAPAPAPAPPMPKAKAKPIPPMRNKKPQEKLQTAVNAYDRALKAYLHDLTNRRLRAKVHKEASEVRTVAQDFRLPVPVLTPVPDLPDSKRGLHMRAKALAKVQVVVDPAMPKDEIRFEAEGQEVGRLVNIAAPEPSQSDVYPHHAGPHPYVPPTTQDLREILAQVDPNASLEEVLTQIQTDMAAASESEEVHHPAHYTSGRIECIDAMREALGDENFVAYCRGAAFKYVWRAGLKGDARIDLEKAAWYCRRAAEVLAEGQLDASVAKAG